MTVGSNAFAPERSPISLAVEQLVAELALARKDEGSARLRAVRLSEAIRLLLRDLPASQRLEWEALLAKVGEGYAGIDRHGEVLGKVIRLFKDQPGAELSVLDAQEELRGEAEVEPKALYNAFAYLARTGRLQRVARGRYVMRGYGAEIEGEEIDDGTIRRSENND